MSGDPRYSQQRCHDSWAMVAGKAIVCGRYVIYYEAVVKPGNESRCDMLQILDKVEEKYFASDATVAPGGWCVGVGAATRLPSGHDVMKPWARRLPPPPEPVNFSVYGG